MNDRAHRRLRAALSLVAACALMLVGAAAVPGAAGADGDPASDVLVAQDTFLPFTPAVSAPLARALNATVARAHAAGYPIKVALIESKLDLGADPELFGTPERYARFLAYEITYNQTPPLLVVMPQGFGTAATAPVTALSSVAVEDSTGSDGLARAAITAVVTLSRRVGHPIAAPALPAAGSSGSGAPVAAIAAGMAVALMLAAGGFAGARGSRRRRAMAHR